jgi:methanethiol S-methyltransferase
MLLNHFFIFLSWSLYCFLHSWLAATGTKIKMQQVLKNNFRFYRLGYTLFAFLSLAAILYFIYSVESVLLFPMGGIIMYLGIVISVAGIVLMAFCIKKYFLSLSGLLSLFKEESEPRLMVDGLHQYMRHPLYMGTFMFIWGLFLVIPYLSFLVTNVVITVYTLIGIVLEEEKLVAQFGNEYRAYQKKVPKLIPSVGFKNS